MVSMSIRRCLIGLLVSALACTLVFASANPAPYQALQEKINLPDGFEIAVYALVPGARSMTLDRETGTVYVGTREHTVYAVVPDVGGRKAYRVEEVLRGLKIPNGVTVYRGDLYVAEQHRISRYPLREIKSGRLMPRAGEVIYQDLPNKSHHGWRYLRFGPDNKLYVSVGAPCNICDTEGIEATIIRMNPDGSDVEVYARGVRNSVGFDFQPGTGVLFFTDNGVDWMGNDSPPCEVNAAPESGQHFGFPYYGGGRDRHSRWARESPPQDVRFPVVEFNAHVAPLGIRFYTGELFPDDFRNDAFVAQHGSWNRSTPIGYRIMRIRFDEHGKATGKEVFADGWLQRGVAWGRPVDILQLPNGSLLISDDHKGLIYRISYSGKR